MDVLVSVSTGALQAVLSKLAKMLGDEYKLQSGVKDGIRYLRRELESMQAALEKVSEVPADQLEPLVKLWVRDLRDMSYKIEDTVDSYMARVDAADDSGSSTTCCVNVKGIMPGTCKARRVIATEIELIRKQVQEASHRREMYKVDGIAAPARSDPRVISLYEDKEKLVGIANSSEDIVKLLSMGGEGTSEQNLKVVSIVGPPGMGKTTLANFVYQKLEERFECAAFISVSLRPSMKYILSSILRQVTSKFRGVPMTTDKSTFRQESQRYYGDSDKWSDNEVISKIRHVLQDKRYFIVIDDIWDEEAWRHIKCALVENKFGSKIITTSRNTEVARSCCCWDNVDSVVHELLPLSDADSEKLFLHKVCRNGYRAEFDDVARRILEKCEGWPMAIVAIASLLANKTKDQWYRVLNSISTGLETIHGVKDMRFILWLSYCDMPTQLRTCFLYLSLFPEDHIIGRDDLIWRWMAEGFIHGAPDYSPYEQGCKYFNELISRSMIQPAHVDNLGTAQACRVHDVVLEFINFLSAEENFVTILFGQPFPSEPDRIHRLSLQYSKEDHGVPLAVKRLPHVRTLFVFSQATDSMPSLTIFPLLRVLELEHCTSHNIKGMEALVHLRYLRLEISEYGWDKGCEKRFLRYLRNLKNLEILYICAHNLSLDFMLNWTPQHLRGFIASVDPQTEHINRAGSVWAQFSPFCTLPRWINSSLSMLFHISIIVRILQPGDLDILADLPTLDTLDLEVIDATQEKLVVTSNAGYATTFRCLTDLRFACRALGILFRPGAMQKLRKIGLSFSLAETNDLHGDFHLGLENLISLNSVEVRMDCRGAKVSHMQEAEGAMHNATNLNPNHPTIDVMKHFEYDMLWDGKVEIPMPDTMEGEEGAQVARIGLWGGNSGHLRDIDVSPRRLRTATICSGDVINSLEFSYSDHNGKVHTVGPWGGEGGHGGDEHTIRLASSEFLVNVAGTMKRYRHASTYVITSLTLVTNACSYGPFGKGGGYPFSTQLHSNSSIVGFFARTGWFVDAIGFYVKDEQEIMDDEEEVPAKIGPWGGDNGYHRDTREPPCHF